MHRHPAQRFTFALPLAAALALLAGCADDGPLYSAQVFFEPNQPITGKKITMRVAVTKVAGGALTGGTVTVSGGGLATTTLTADPDTAGTYVSTKISFPADGSHSLALKMSGADGDETHTVPITSTCGTNGEEGAPCCKADACTGGLTCVYGVCRSDKMGDGGPCHGAEECQSGVCTDEKCAAPVCDDGVKNGPETDLDCGGSCALKCGSMKGCKVDGDCVNGACIGGLCGLGPGELLGLDGKKDPAVLTEILNHSMSGPIDLAFNTSAPNELWVVNKPTDSFTVIFDPGKKGQLVATIADYSQHFMEEVTAIAFSDNAKFGTCGESNNTYGGKAKPNNFMGPVLWPAQYQSYTKVASAHSIHDDMLHSSPFCMGMAAITANQYYVFNGQQGTIDWYDFKVPHVPGGTDHSDGVKRRYDGLKVKRVNDVASHMHYVNKTGWLYVADTGNARVVRMNDSGSQQGKWLPSFGGDGIMHAWSAPQVEQLVAPPGGFQQPSGLAVHADTLYIGDAQSGKLHAFDIKEAGKAGTFGKHIKSFDTGLAGKLAGLEVGPDQRLYLVDRSGRILRLDP